MRDTIHCPQFDSSAQITERFWLGSTAGPVEHVRIGCVNNHWLTPLAEVIARAQPDPSPAATEAVPA
jgi:hypothetical protein